MSLYRKVVVGQKEEKFQNSEDHGDPGNHGDPRNLGKYGDPGDDRHLEKPS